ncbi:broad specificity phosphatase PhoE [Litoreibacter halocynthiae]|uniref:Broad specificity phosphatase PhoE n=1 Tax=Litoreibacter halocynthiae TaxID=1242689 RepID=A0A4R7LN33_9RHOB|nr:histidine phosphatase family protein [Litoreibacter halocynthiae]TDT76839.1 broad specificity phosphatase PhoE [Litoreibacter halocynthiae]
MKTTRLWWVRHGPTHEKAFTGWRDVAADLSDTDKIVRLHTYLPRNAALVSSDLIRARSTADVIGLGRTRLPHDPDLRELDFGVWDGLHFSKVADMHPELSRAYWETPGDVKPPEGESWNDLHARLTPKVEALHDSEHVDVVIVAHMGVIMSQIERALGVTPYAAMSHQIEPLSVTRIDIGPDGWRADVINHQP